MLSLSRLHTLMLLPALLLACGGDDHDCHDDAGPPAWHADGSRVCYPDPASDSWAMCMLGGEVEGHMPNCRDGERPLFCFLAMGDRFDVSPGCTRAEQVDGYDSWQVIDD